MMLSCMKTALICCHILGFMLFVDCLALPHYSFTVEEATYNVLCKTMNILTVNGKFPGPTLYARKGDTIFVDVYNKGKYNITIHWHGVKQPRNPWSDGPEYITQCAIKPGGFFRYKLIFSTEEGTLWWHAHSDWWRATVHGAIVVYPKIGSTYPFPKPHSEIPIILGEWWNQDINQVLMQMLRTGGAPNISDAFTINGLPGDLYPCSSAGTFKLTVDYGKTYLLRMVNAGLNEILFLAIAKHPIIVVGIDGSYTKPLTRNYITISPGQTYDVLLHANQTPGQYYMAGRAYSSNPLVPFDNTTTTAIVQYNGNYTKSPQPLLPSLPYYTNTGAFLASVRCLRSLASKAHPANVPKKITNRIFTTISINRLPCGANLTCAGPNGTRLAASMSNITFRDPSPIDILQAYYRHVRKVYGTNFPNFPPLVFNYTADNLPSELAISRPGTEVKILEYNSTVEIIFQGTSLGALDHPMHLHGYSFYVIGIGLGNFNESTDPLNYNLVDPPLRNTAIVPRNGWMTIRFEASNPGVWFVHCHFERHMTWGMDTLLIVKDGKTPESKILPPPPYMPPC